MFSPYPIPGPWAMNKALSSAQNIPHGRITNQGYRLRLSPFATAQSACCRRLAFELCTDDWYIR